VYKTQMFLLLDTNHINAVHCSKPDVMQKSQNLASSVPPRGNGNWSQKQWECSTALLLSKSCAILRTVWSVNCWFTLKLSPPHIP